MVLIVEEVEWILDTPIPLLLGNYTAEHKEYDRWYKLNQKDQAYISHGMSKILTAQFEHFKMAKEILDAIKEMLESSPDMNKQKVLDLLNNKMSEGGSVVNHVMTLMEYVQGCKDNRGVMDNEMRVSIIMRI